MTTPSKLQPFQELLKRLESVSHKAIKRFQLVPKVMQYGFTGLDKLGLYGLMIEDYVWWMDNERAILNWMVDNLPHGIEHQQGMFVYFPTDEDRVVFLLRWGG